MGALCLQTCDNPGPQAMPFPRRLLCPSDNTEASHGARRLVHILDPSWLLVSFQQNGAKHPPLAA